MTDRSHDDFAHERQTLDALHAQNEAQRDNFVGLAHTALFAASVSFVGSVTPLAKAVWRPLLIAGWTADVIGLLALTLSFVAARRALDQRRAALYSPDAPASPWIEAINAVALWSFPVALLSLFFFVTANVVHADDRQIRQTTAGQLRDQGHGSAAPNAQPPRPIEPADGHRAATPCACGTAAG